MARVTRTLEQHEDAMGAILLLTAIDTTTRLPVAFRLRDLPPAAIAVVIAWLNDRISSPLT
jgi:hypothetical protein